METLGIAYSSTGNTTAASVSTYPITAVLSNGTGLTSGYCVTLTPGVLTVNPVVPTLTTPTATSITSSIATLGGTISATGGANIAKRGILFAPTTTNLSLTLHTAGVVEIDDAGAAVGAFAEPLTGLSPSTSYSFVAFAKFLAEAPPERVILRQLRFPPRELGRAIRN